MTDAQPLVVLVAFWAGMIGCLAVSFWRRPAKGFLDIAQRVVFWFFVLMVPLVVAVIVLDGPGLRLDWANGFALAVMAFVSLFFAFTSRFLFTGRFLRD